MLRNLGLRPPSPEELAGRVALALSILNHRPPSLGTVLLAIAALQGVPLEALARDDVDPAV